MLLFVKAEARQGSDGNPNNGRDVRPTSQQRRGNESMSAYYKRTGVSMLGGNARTRGRAATVTQRGR